MYGEMFNSSGDGGLGYLTEYLGNATFTAINEMLKTLIPIDEEEEKASTIATTTPSTLAVTTTTTAFEDTLPTMIVGPKFDFKEPINDRHNILGVSKDLPWVAAGLLVLITWTVLRIFYHCCKTTPRGERYRYDNRNIDETALNQHQPRPRRSNRQRQRQRPRSELPHEQPLPSYEKLMAQEEEYMNRLPSYEDVFATEGTFQINVDSQEKEKVNRDPNDPKVNKDPATDKVTFVQETGNKKKRVFADVVITIEPPTDDEDEVSDPEEVKEGRFYIKRVTPDPIEVKRVKSTPIITIQPPTDDELSDEDEEATWDQGDV